MKGRDVKADITFLFTLGLICIKLWDFRSTYLPADGMVAEGRKEDTSECAGNTR